jgi:HAD superfamily hydrolase (TIGR01509 family)
LVIFDCNGVLVDSERLAAAVASQELTRAGFALPPEVIGRYFTGRRPADMFLEIERAARRKLPDNFELTVKAATLLRFRKELRTTAHAAYALSWLRGPKCVASSSPFDRIRLSLETTDLFRYFDPYLFSATEVTKGKPAPDLFQLAAAKMHVEPADCIVVEDSPVGVAAAVAAGMKAIGFVGGSHAGDQLGAQLTQQGARIIINDMRALKTAIVNLRGW